MSPLVCFLAPLWIVTVFLGRGVHSQCLHIMFVTPVREATDHRPKEVDRQQRILGTQTEHMEEASVSKRVSRFDHPCKHVPRVCLEVLRGLPGARRTWLSAELSIILRVACNESHPVPTFKGLQLHACTVRVGVASVGLAR